MHNKVGGCLALLIGLIVFNVIAFAIPVEHNFTFWIVYAFTDLAFFAQAVIWKWAFSNSIASRNKFFGVPLAYVGLVYLFIQVISFAFCLVYSVADWIAVIVCVVVFGLAVIVLILGDIGRFEIKKIDDSVMEDISFLKTLRMEIDILFEREDNPEIKNKLKELVDMVRYCDPTSSPATQSVDENIQQVIEKWKNTGVAVEEIARVKSLINTRKKMLISDK